MTDNSNKGDDAAIWAILIGFAIVVAVISVMAMFGGILYVFGAT